MAFSHGRQSAVYANGYDISGYLKSFGMQAKAESHDVTTFGKTSRVKRGGLKDGTADGEGLFDGDAGAINDILEVILGANDKIFVHMHEGDGFGNDGLAIQGIEVTYKIGSPVDGMVDLSLEVESSIGVEPVETLHELSAEAESGNGTSLDNLASSANGGSVFVICSAGTAVTFAVEDSANGTDWTAISGVTIAAQTGPAATRVAISGTIREYTRITWDKACTFWAALHRA